MFPRSELSSYRWPKRRKQYNWSNGNPKYIAYHFDIDANETDTNWEITKYSSDTLEDEGPRLGAVNTEAVINALDWNI